MATSGTPAVVTKWQFDQAGCCRAGAIGLWVLINLPAAVVLCRSTSGQLQSLSGAGAAGLACLLSVISLAAASLWCSVEEPCGDRRDLIWRKTWQGLLNTFPLAVLWDTSVPSGVPFAAAVTIGLGVALLTATLLGKWWAFSLPISLPTELSVETARPAPAVEFGAAATEVAEEDSEIDEELESEMDEGGPQFPKGAQWQMRNTDGGHEVIEGVSVARMPAGQKQLQVHIAFCPPLASAPQVEHDFPDGTPVRSKVGAVYPYGLRLEIRRNGEAAGDLVFPVHYTAWVSDDQSRVNSLQSVVLPELSRQQSGPDSRAG